MLAGAAAGAAAWAVRDTAYISFADKLTTYESSVAHESQSTLRIGYLSNIYAKDHQQQVKNRRILFLSHFDAYAWETSPWQLWRTNALLEISEPPPSL